MASQSTHLPYSILIIAVFQRHRIHLETSSDIHGSGGKPIHSSRSKVLKMVTLVSIVVAFAITCFGSPRQSHIQVANAIPPRHPGVMITGALRRTDAYRDARRALLSKRYALAQSLLHSLLQRPWITVSDRTFIARQLHLVRAAAAKGGAR